jgi:DNA replication protein DnaC
MAIEESQATATTTEQVKTKEQDIRITKESILEDVIDDINKLENRAKSAKSLVDLLILHRYMKLELHTHYE